MIAESDLHTCINNITRYVDHTGADFLSAVNLTRTEFHSNPALEITLWNFYYLQREKLQLVLLIIIFVIPTSTAHVQIYWM